MTYCDDIQDAEEAVDTVAWVNLLHHTFFAILEDRNNTCISVCIVDIDSIETGCRYTFVLKRATFANSHNPLVA